MRRESASVASGHRSPCASHLPADALETTAVGKGAGVLWVLTAEAALPGVNLREDFDVPVRRTESKPRAAGGSEDPQLRTAANP